MDAGAASVALPWLCPAVEKSGDALLERTWLGSRNMPERCHSGTSWLAHREQVKLEKPRGEETELRPHQRLLRYLLPGTRDRT